MFRDVESTLLFPYPIMQLDILAADFFLTKANAVAIIFQVGLGDAYEHFHICVR